MDARLFANSGQLFDLAGAMQTDLKRVLRPLRDEFGWTLIETLVQIYDDRTLDPRSGAVFGHRAIAAALARSKKQVRRSVYDTDLRHELGWAHGVPASTVQSLDLVRGWLDTHARDANLAALGRRTAP